MLFWKEHSQFEIILCTALQEFEHCSESKTMFFIQYPFNSNLCEKAPPMPNAPTRVTHFYRREKQNMTAKKINTKTSKRVLFFLHRTSKQALKLQSQKNILTIIQATIATSTQHTGRVRYRNGFYSFPCSPQHTYKSYTTLTHSTHSNKLKIVCGYFHFTARAAESPM